MRYCGESAEALVEDVVHPADSGPDVYNYDCDRHSPHVQHHAETWNPGINVEWTDAEFTVVRVMA